MKLLRTVRNYFCYCGIEKDEYKALKKDAYVSNFAVWRVLHCLITAVFAGLFTVSLSVNILETNRWLYLAALGYSAVATFLFFFVLKKDSVTAQLMIYLTISMLFLFGGFITQNKPLSPATTFIVFLLITPMFMIDKPYFMAIELSAASVIFLVWMHAVKPAEIWKMDLINIIVFALVGIFIHIIANSIRIKEFVLARKLKIQKDTDDLTGTKNKSAVTREINAFLADETKDKGILLMLDIDRFKNVNDTYGHDVGDSVINQLGRFLDETFVNGEIVGRFGGDEFIVFIKDTDNVDFAFHTARRIVEGAARTVKLPDRSESVSVSIGIAVYHGEEKNYSQIFKKADIALYKTKADRTVKYNIYKETA
ncbi:MAG: GGDEF domain-containing protein [Clostridia bacterium]|nr:GGDEF domain-containing protein [Clostridia bacterium]